MKNEGSTKKRLFTKRMILRPFELEDAEFIYQSFNDSLSLKFVGDRNIHSLKDAEIFLFEKVLKRENDYSYCFYAMVDKRSLKTIGSCGLFYNTTCEAIDIGFSCLKEHRGHGYVKEAAEIVLLDAVENPEIDMIRATVDARNFASKKILENNNFEYKSSIFEKDIEVQIYWKQSKYL